jgi:hypothetical protein
MTFHRVDSSGRVHGDCGDHRLQAASWQPQVGMRADAAMDPVEAYFECITTCSLDDGECVTSCTQILRES